MSVIIGDVTLSEEELQDGFSAEEIFSAGGARGRFLFSPHFFCFSFLRFCANFTCFVLFMFFDMKRKIIFAHVFCIIL